MKLAFGLILYFAVVAVLLVVLPMAFWQLLIPSTFIARLLTFAMMCVYDFFMACFIFMVTGGIIAVLAD